MRLVEAQDIVKSVERTNIRKCLSNGKRGFHTSYTVCSLPSHCGTNVTVQMIFRHTGNTQSESQSSCSVSSSNCSSSRVRGSNANMKLLWRPKGADGGWRIDDRSVVGGVSVVGGGSTMTDR